MKCPLKSCLFSVKISLPSSVPQCLCGEDYLFNVIVITNDPKKPAKFTSPVRNEFLENAVQVAVCQACPVLFNLDKRAFFNRNWETRFSRAADAWIAGLATLGTIGIGEGVRVMRAISFMV